MSVDAPSIEDLSLLDIEPYSMDDLALLAGKLLEKMNEQGKSRMTVNEMVVLRLIRTCFEV